MKNRPVYRCRGEVASFAIAMPEKHHETIEIITDLRGNPAERTTVKTVQLPPLLVFVKEPAR